MTRPIHTHTHIYIRYPDPLTSPSPPFQEQHTYLVSSSKDPGRTSPSNNRNTPFSSPKNARKYPDPTPPLPLHASLVHSRPSLCPPLPSAPQSATAPPAATCGGPARRLIRRPATLAALNLHHARRRGSFRRYASSDWLHTRSFCPRCGSPTSNFFLTPAPLEALYGRAAGSV